MAGAAAKQRSAPTRLPFCSPLGCPAAPAQPLVPLPTHPLQRGTHARHPCRCVRSNVQPRFMSFTPQARENLDVAKARIKEAEKRIDADLDAYIAKAYWTEGRNELRRQVSAARCMRLACVEVSYPLPLAMWAPAW